MSEMIRAFCFSMLLLLAVAPSSTIASHDVLAGGDVLSATLHDVLPQARQVGVGRLRVLFWDIYDAALYAPDGRWQTDKPFLLTMTYLRDVESNQLADVVIDEMRKQGLRDQALITQWRGWMAERLPNITKGDILAALMTPDGNTMFFFRGKLIADIHDADFTRRFWSIILAENSRFPLLRQQLLGLE